MKTELTTAALKSGESLRITCVLGPDPDEAGRIGGTLGHKGGIWNWQIAKSLTQTLDGLESRFYIGELDGELAGNVCTFEQGGVGILGHVFTRDDHRRKGIASVLMAAVTDDFRRRGGTTLFLGTGYDSPAYHIYQGFGFRGIAPESGSMRYDAVPDASDSVPPDSPVTVREANWGDWARLNLLLMRPGEPFLRNQAFGWYGPSNIEGGFLEFLAAREKGRPYRAWVLETGTKIPVGFATLTPARSWPQPLHQLDLCLRPEFRGKAGFFLASLPLPEGKVQAFTQANDPAFSDAWAAAGFEQEGLLRGHLVAGEENRDVAVWGRG